MVTNLTLQVKFVRLIVRHETTFYNNFRVYLNKVSLVYHDICCQTTYKYLVSLKI